MRWRGKGHESKEQVTCVLRSAAFPRHVRRSPKGASVGGFARAWEHICIECRTRIEDFLFLRRKDFVAAALSLKMNIKPAPNALFFFFYVCVFGPGGKVRRRCYSPLRDRSRVVIRMASEYLHSLKFNFEVRVNAYSFCF